MSTHDLLPRLRQVFGEALAESMGYDTATGSDLAAELQVRQDGDDLWLRFDWCQLEQTASPASSIDEAEKIAVAFALSVADDLKEHRGGDRVPLPWDSRNTKT